jgi:hypothetical protein
MRKVVLSGAPDVLFFSASLCADGQKKDEA